MRFTVIVLATAVAVLQGITATSMAHKGTETDVRTLGVTFGDETSPAVTVPVQLCYEVDGTTGCVLDKTWYVTLPSTAKMELSYVTEGDTSSKARLKDCPGQRAGQQLVAKQTGKQHRGFRARITSGDGTLTLFDSGWYDLDGSAGNAEVTFSACVGGNGKDKVG